MMFLQHPGDIIRKMVQQEKQDQETVKRGRCEWFFIDCVSQRKMRAQAVC